MSTKNCWKWHVASDSETLINSDWSYFQKSNFGDWMQKYAKVILLILSEGLSFFTTCIDMRYLKHWIGKGSPLWCYLLTDLITTAPPKFNNLISALSEPDRFAMSQTTSGLTRCRGDARWFIDQGIQWQYDRNSRAKLLPPRLKIMLRSSEAK